MIRRMKTKRILALLLIAIALFTVPTAVYAAETETETEVTTTENQTEAKPAFKFGKGFKKPTFDGAKKPAVLPEGFEKPDMSKIKENGFANFKNIDKEAVREKLDALLADGKITQEKYDAIVSGEWKPSFDGEKKFSTLPEGFKKPEGKKYVLKGFGKFKDIDKEAFHEKLDALLAEGKITQEKYDAIISGECKPFFNGAKFPGFKG